LFVFLVHLGCGRDIYQVGYTDRKRSPAPHHGHNKGGHGDDDDGEDHYDEGDGSYLLSLILRGTFIQFGYTDRKRSPAPHHGDNKGDHGDDDDGEDHYDEGDGSSLLFTLILDGIFIGLGIQIASAPLTTGTTIRVTTATTTMVRTTMMRAMVSFDCSS
jgi:hypothetical protein